MPPQICRATEVSLSVAADSGSRSSTRLERVMNSRSSVKKMECVPSRSRKACRQRSCSCQRIHEQGPATRLAAAVGSSEQARTRSEISSSSGAAPRVSISSLRFAMKPENHRQQDPLPSTPSGDERPRFHRITKFQSAWKPFRQNSNEILTPIGGVASGIGILGESRPGETVVGTVPGASRQLSEISENDDQRARIDLSTGTCIWMESQIGHNFTPPPPWGPISLGAAHKGDRCCSRPWWCGARFRHPSSRLRWSR